MTGENHEFSCVYDSNGDLVVGIVITQKMGVGLGWSSLGSSGPDEHEEQTSSYI